MNSASGNDVSNSTVIAEAISTIENLALTEPSRDLTYAEVFPTVLLPSRYQESGRYRILEDVGEAGIVRKGSKYPKMKVTGRNVTYIVEELGTEYAIEKAEIVTAVNNGRPLDTINAETAQRKVQEKINKLAYIGDTEFGEFPGIVELSGVSTYSGTALDTSSLNLANEVINAYQAIPAQFRERYEYTLILPDHMYNVFQAFKDDSSNESWLVLIGRALPRLKIVNENQINGGTETSDGTITTGTALLLPFSNEAMRMPVGLSPTQEVDRVKSGNDYEKYLEGRAVARVGPVNVPFPTAIVKISGWTTV